jgi:hypothetical protein
MLPTDFVVQFRELRTVRNEIVHGAEAPENEKLVEATRRVKSLLSLVTESYNKLTAGEQSQKAHWQGVVWNDKFLCYDGPLEPLRLIEDRPFEHSMGDALSAAGFSIRIAANSRLSSHAEKGYRVVYVTDRGSWRQRVTRGETILVARPEKVNTDIEGR